MSSTYYKHAKHKGVGKFIQLYRDTILLGKAPVIIIYQMGKVGSSSARDTLLDLNIGSVFHLHYFLPWRNLKSKDVSSDPVIKNYLDAEIAHSITDHEKKPLKTKLKTLVHENLFLKPLLKWAVKRNKKTKFIVSVRDPISVNISMFFQCFEQYMGKVYESSNFTTDEILEVFNTKYIFSWPLTWFDKEFKPHTGLDIYDYEFPKDKGYTILENENFEFLVFKVEIPNSAKEKGLAEFVGLNEFKLGSSNIGDEKIYADQYNEFKNRIVIPEELAHELLDSKYCKHFYTDEERAKIFNKWTKKQ